MEVFHRLYGWMGDRHWWPAETPFEVMVGAVLTQNVSWRNVEKAIANLRRAGLLEPAALHRAAEEELYPLVRPAGYYRAKSRKLKALCAFLFERYGGSLEALFSRPLQNLRPELLSVYGVGPETADAMLCYAGNLPIMVMDAYTRRVFFRLGLVPEDISYSDLQAFFMSRLPQDTALFNQYHALIDGLANRLCLKQNPLCSSCPLLELCPSGQANTKAREVLP